MLVPQHSCTRTGKSAKYYPFQKIFLLCTYKARLPIKGIFGHPFPIMISTKWKGFIMKEKLTG